MTFCRVECGDAVEWLGGLASSSVDCIITDPAYESLEKHRAVGTTTRLTGEWFAIFHDDRFPALLAECFRVLRPDRHLYILFDQTTARIVTPLAEAAGFTWWKWIVWDKVSPGMGYHYRARHELIGFFEKGKRKVNNLGVLDVLAVKRVQGGYPTEKPVEVLVELVLQSTQPGEWVVDPFCGSGSTGVAAARHGRHFLGCDLSERAVQLATSRLDKGELK
jgi:site-specific DNA-methyltransferase (adenine-specific)